MGGIKTRTKPFLSLVIFIVLTAVSGCRFSPEINQTKGSLMVAVGVSPPGQARMTYTPDFSLYDYEKITISVTQEETVFADIVLDPRNDSSVIELLDLPYGAYDISARAYFLSDDEEEDYTAAVDMEFNFSYNSYWATIMLDPIMGGEGTRGVLRYKLINAIGFPVSAILYPYDEINNPEFKITLTQGLNPLDTISGFHTMNLDTGYYMFFFGEYAPSIVHIYQNMDTVLESEYSIYGALSKVINPQAESDVQIVLRRDGTVLGNDEIISYGTDISITIVTGDNYRYIAGSLTLNGGIDDNWFITPEVKTPDGNYTRTFRMPGNDVEISIETEPLPKVDFDFYDPNMYNYIHFRRVSDNAVIDSVNPGEQITVVFDNPTDTVMPFAVLSWLLDISPQSGPASPVFAVPVPCTAWNVTAMVTIGNVPYSVSIPIRQN